MFSLLEDNLKKWASTCGLSSEDILQQLANARPLSPRQLIRKSDEDVVTTDDEMPTSKAAKGSSQRPRALISDEQVVTLKAYYGLNPKPRREELIKISEEIGMNMIYFTKCLYQKKIGFVFKNKNISRSPIQSG